MTLRLNGSTSGYTEIDAPAAAGNNTLVLPTGNGTADQVIATNGSGALSFADRGRLVLGTSQASTSGTVVDFTGIPSWVKRVTVMFSGVSVSGTSAFLIQLGTSSGFVATGYSGGGARFGTNSFAGAAFTTGLSVNNTTAAALYSGHVVWTNVSGNLWAGSLAMGASATEFAGLGGSSISLSGTLDRVRITTVNGTDTFDAGSINILYEG
jgi:hypothetical protein